MRVPHLLLVVPALAAACSPFRTEATPEDLAKIALPEGFRIGLWSADVPGARSLTVSPSGTVFVGTRDEGRVYALRDEDGDGRAERRFVLAEGLEQPNGVAFRDGALYVAEVSRVLRFDGIEARLDRPPEPVVVTDRYPDDGHHGWKFVAFGPDGRLYVPVGAPCNVCLEPDPYATITRLDVETGEHEVFARGIRNTVGFDFRPGTGELWFTDNGADWMGDEEPRDELNRAPGPGLHFGFPFVHADGLRDDEFWERRGARTAADFTPPAQLLGPHVAALGMRFYRGAMFPEEYRGQVFVAEHGSWNRTTLIGYRVTLVRLEGDRATGYEPFATGWLHEGMAWGRPVDVQELEDGSLLVSDDYAGAIYRITYAPR